MFKKSLTKPDVKESKPIGSVKETKLVDRVMGKYVLNTREITKPKNYIVIDHPVNNEKLNYHHYAIRIGANWTSDGVEICINNGEWQKCRHSVGYWWYDWPHIPAGEHTIVARSKDEKGKVVTKSTIIKCRF